MKKTIRFKELGCANCAGKMERAIAKLDGVRDITINFMARKMILDADDDRFDYILDEAQKIISKIEPEAAVIL